MKPPHLNPIFTRPAIWVFEFILWLFVVGLLAFAVSGCSALRRHAWTGGGAAGGAAVGALVGGPVGAGVGGAVGAIGVGAIAESQELRDGDLVGDEALVKQAALWRMEALESRAKIDWYGRAKMWAAALLAAWFAWRNREHLLAFGPGYLGRLAHAMFGTKINRRVTA